MNYDLLWILYFLIAGLLTYFVFKTDIIFIVLAVVALELAYYLIYRTKWNFVRRYLFNLFYVVGYVTPLVFS